MHSKSFINVRYAETDRMGIVHHKNHAVWYEVGRSDYLKMFGTSYREMEEAGLMCPLTNINCHFKTPATYDDKLIIRTWAIALHGARIQFTYTVKRINDDGTETEIGYGTTEHGFIDKTTFRPVSLKKRMPDLYEKIRATL